MSQQIFEGLRLEQNHLKCSSSTILHFVKIEACFTILVFEKEDKIIYFKTLFISSPEKVAGMYLNSLKDERAKIRYISFHQDKVMVSSQILPASANSQSYLEANYIFFCLKIMLHFNPPHDLLDKIKFMEYFTLILSQFPEQRLILNLKLQNRTHLNRLMRNKLNFTNNFIWNKKHVKVLDRFEKLRNLSCVKSFARKKINAVKGGQNIYYYNIKPSYDLKILQDIFAASQIKDSIETNTELTREDTILEMVKNIKVPLCIFNGSLWKAALCGDSMWTKMDFSSYILKCSCFDEVLNLDPALNYVRDWIEPLNSSMFLKKILKDLGKALLSTLFPCPI